MQRQFAERKVGFDLRGDPAKSQGLSQDIGIKKTGNGQLGIERAQIRIFD